MKLLIITQKVDISDDVLGFFHSWLEKLAKEADLFVIANFVGNYDLPSNVKVYSLGKERKSNSIFKLFYYKWLFLKLLPKVDGVFFHMCPEYVLAAFLAPKFFGKKTLFWYAHKQVDFKLRTAEKLVDKIFTASPESFRLPSKKLEVAGHGIDTERFKPAGEKNASGSGILKIVSADRISPIKNQDILIKAAEILRRRNINFEIEIANVSILKKDRVYLEQIKKIINDNGLGDKINFVGSIPHKEIVSFYQNADILVNLSDTGSIDKAVLEAMASGCLVLTSNEAFRNILAEKYLTSKDPAEIAQKLIDLSISGQDEKPRQYVFDNHNLDNLVNKIINFFKNGK